MRKYFITGISGFLGRNLVLSIKKRGDYHIYGLALKGDPAFKLYEDDPDVTLIEGDILDPSSLDRFLIEADRNSYFIHSAGRVSVLGKNDPLTTRINYDGTISVVEALKKRGIHRLLFVSSVDALSIEEGKETIEPTSFDPDIGMGVYGKSKAKAGNYVLEEYRNNNFPAIIVCPSAILGPDDPFSAPMNDVLRRYDLGKIPVRTPGGYDIVDVRDVAEGILLALEKGRVGEVYLLTGNRVSVKTLFEEFSLVTGRKPPKIQLPYWVLYMVSPLVEAFARMRKKRPLFSPLAIDCLRLNPIYIKKKAIEELGYSSRPIEETIKDTYEFLKKKG